MTRHRRCHTGNLSTRQRGRKRFGSATVELAVCLPVMVMLVIGAIEGASMAFLKQAMTQAAYEGVKVAVRRGNTLEDGRIAAQQVLDSRNLGSATVSFNPSNIEGSPAGTVLRITISAPSDSNSIIPFGPFQGREVIVDSYMAKE